MNRCSSVNTNYNKYGLTLNSALTSSNDVTNSLSIKLNNSDSGMPCSLLPGVEINFDNNKSDLLFKKITKNLPSICTEQLDTQSWLNKYGLKASKLSYQQILSMIGFKQMQGKNNNNNNNNNNFSFY